MIEKIYTIPITESFEERCGCPVCRLHAKAREKALEYILQHPECQQEDPEFDAWCDRVIEVLEEAKKKI